MIKVKKIGSYHVRGKMIEKASKKEVVRLNIEVSVNLRNELKLIALKKNISLNKYLTRIILTQILKEKSYG